VLATRLTVQLASGLATELASPLATRFAAGLTTGLASPGLAIQLANGLTAEFACPFAVCLATCLATGLAESCARNDIRDLVAGIGRLESVEIDDAAVLSKEDHAVVRQRANVGLAAEVLDGEDAAVAVHRKEHRLVAAAGLPAGA
jgi:hypothetical protein